MVTFERPFPTPDFSLPNLDGNIRSLASFRGQYVLFNFWATWCPLCLEEMPSMEKLHTTFAKQQFTVVAASPDKNGASAVQPFIDKLGVTFPILPDTKKEVASVYGAQDLPLSFLINPQGQVIAAAKGARDRASTQAIEVVSELIAK
jgi:cytochrome c biogenesis protein CcmG/thiol:disulfide interchange protein DsbE